MKKMTMASVKTRIEELKNSIAQGEENKKTLPSAFAQMIDTHQQRKDMEILKNLTQDDIDRVNQMNEEFPAIGQYPYQ